MSKKAELNVVVPESVLARLNGAIPGNGFEYIVSCTINETDELLLHTNYGRTLNAGKIPVGELTEKHYEKIIERVEASESLNPVFVVAFNSSGDDFTADKTFAEVKAAVDQGDVVVGDWVMNSNVRRGRLTGISDELLEFTFHGYWCADEYLILQNDDRVEHLVSEVGKGEMPSRVAVVKTDTQLTVTATYGWKDEETVIVLNDDGDPVSVTKGDQTTVLTWEGFDE